ncbi:MAG: hypothetical protein LUH56_05030 [Oscillospiraceae bacterium]|nr:hypothetical protein [Oscillospiraceae bacterium]
MKRIIAIVAVIAIVFTARVIYVNAFEYRFTEKTVHATGETFTLHDLELTCTYDGIYSSEELAKLYGEEILSYCDESDLILTIEITNPTGEEKTLDLTSFRMQYAFTSGGGINPYLFGYLNEGIGGSKCTIESGKTVTVLLPYPYDWDTLGSEKPYDLVLSLYPENVRVRIVEK